MAKFTAGNNFGQGRRTKEETQKRLNEEIKRIANKSMEIMGEKITEDLTKRARMSITQFYKDYRPMYYIRTENLYNAISNIKKTTTNGKYQVGVSLSPSTMDQVYRADKEFVFDLAFRQGLHGFNNFRKMNKPEDSDELDEDNEDMLYGSYLPAPQTRSIKSYMDIEFKDYDAKKNRTMEKYFVEAVNEARKKKGR